MMNIPLFLVILSLKTLKTRFFLKFLINFLRKHLEVTEKSHTFALALKN